MDGRLRSMTSVYLTNPQGIYCLFRIGSRIADHLYVGSAGGHFEPGEVHDARACVLREMHEELGISENDVSGLALRYITLRLKNGEIRQNYVFFAQLKEDRLPESNEGRLSLIPYADIPALPMPISAKHVILHYLREGRRNHTLYAGVSESADDDGIRFVPLREF